MRNIPIIGGFYILKLKRKRKIEYILYRGKEYFDPKILENWLPWKVSTIRKYIQSGRIEGIKVKGKWLVSRKNLYKYLGGKQKVRENPVLELGK